MTRREAADRRRTQKRTQDRVKILERIVKLSRKHGTTWRLDDRTDHCLLGQTGLVVSKDNCMGGAIAIIHTCSGCANTFISRLKAAPLLTTQMVERIPNGNVCRIAVFPVPIPFPLPDAVCLLSFPGPEHGCFTLREGLLRAQLETEITLSTPTNPVSMELITQMTAATAAVRGTDEAYRFANTFGYEVVEHNRLNNTWRIRRRENNPDDNFI